MSLGKRFTQAYFNVAYNRVYDLTTARLNHYRHLQERCVSRLKLSDNDKILCVGLGTGNEILHILRRNTMVNIIGIDHSSVALKKAHRKAVKLGKEVWLLPMDAHSLQFANESFDKVLCLHVMDFVERCSQVTSEIIRC